MLKSDTLVPTSDSELWSNSVLALPYSMQNVGTQSNEHRLMQGIPVKAPPMYKTDSFVFWILLFQLFLFASVRILHPSAYSFLLGDVLRYKMALQRYSHHDTDPLIIDITLRISALVSISLLLAYALNFFGLAPFSFGLLLKCATMLLLYYIFKKIIDHLMAFVFGIDFILGFLQFYTDQLIKFFGLLIYPITILLTYLNGSELLWLLYLTGGLLLLILSIRFIRGIALTSSHLNRHFFHIILYICTLEIIPFLLILKESIKFLKS